MKQFLKRTIMVSLLLTSVGGISTAWAENIRFTDTEESDHNRDTSRWLPFYGDEARARGYDLPNPIGLSYTYMDMRQDIVVESIDLSLPMLPNWITNTLNIIPGETKQTSKTHTFKIDAWILPFMNMYGIIGKTKGNSKTNLTNIEIFGSSIATNVPFNLKFEGQSYGAGITFAGGYKNVFGVFDANYTYTSLDILDGQIKSLVISPRIGYIFRPQFSGMPELTLKVWTGAMYQKITQRFKGDIMDLDLGVPGLGAILQDSRFDVKQHLETDWNQTIGAQLELTKNFNILTEIGFNKRETYMISGEFRF